MRSIRDAMRTRRGRGIANRSFHAFCIVVTSLSIVALATLLGSILWHGRIHLDWGFLNAYASRRPADAGFKAALWGSVWICSVCAVIALPLGVGTAIYLEEFARRNRLTRFLQFNITNLAAVPSIVYGLIGLTAFAKMWGFFGTALDPAWEFGQESDWWHLRLPFGSSVLTSGLTLMLVILPVVIVSSQEALRSVPRSLRQGARALGASQWLTVSRIVLPSAIPGVMTGSILAMSRAVGEAAPLLIAGGILFMRFTPESLMSYHTAMPLQIYDWASRPQEDFHDVAASGILVLLTVLLLFNGVATLIRSRFEKPVS